MLASAKNQELIDEGKMEKFLRFGKLAIFQLMHELLQS